MRKADCQEQTTSSVSPLYQFMNRLQLTTKNVQAVERGGPSRSQLPESTLEHPKRLPRPAFPLLSAGFLLSACVKRPHNPDSNFRRPGAHHEGLHVSIGTAHWFNSK